MGMRKKLIELIEQADGHSSLEIHDIYRFVDSLIANGVTIQKWIPVTERLPDLELVEAKTQDIDLYPCLCVVLNPRAKNGKYVSKLYFDGCSFVDVDSCDFTDNVTHWMPLPEAPKGE